MRLGHLLRFRHFLAALVAPQTETGAPGRLVAQKDELRTLSACTAKKACCVSKKLSFAAAANFLQDVRLADDDLRLTVEDYTLVLQPLQADRHPLAGRADHVGNVCMGEGRADQNAFLLLDAIGIDEMEEKVREPLGD